MIAAPQIERATLADLESLARLRVELGWYRSDPLLQAALTWEGARIFVVRVGALDGARGDLARLPAATTSAIAAGPVGVIGNVGVRPEFQRRGLGKLLTTHAIEWQRAQGVRSIWLDATPAGRPLYRSLGFTDIATSWIGLAPLRDLHYELLVSAAATMIAEPAAPDALASVAALDHAAFGGDRMGLLFALARQDEYSLYIARDRRDEARRPLGYALARRLEQPIRGIRLGPLVAPDDAVASALILAAALAERRRLSADFASGALRFTVGGGDMPEARALFDAIGAPTTNDDLVMRLTLPSQGDDSAIGRDVAPGQTEGRPRVYSWVAPMLF